MTNNTINLFNLFLDTEEIIHKIIYNHSQYIINIHNLKYCKDELRFSVYKTTSENFSLIRNYILMPKKDDNIYNMYDMVPNYTLFILNNKKEYIMIDETIYKYDFNSSYYYKDLKKWISSFCNKNIKVCINCNNKLSHNMLSKLCDNCDIYQKKIR